MNTPATQAPKAYTRMTASEKAEAISLWKMGTMTIDDLVGKYGRSRSTLLNLFKKARVKKGEASDVIQDAVEKKVLEQERGKAVAAAAEHAIRVRDSKDGRFKLATLIQKLIGKSIVDSINRNEPIGLKGNDLKALQAAAQAAKLAGDEQFAALGIREGEGSTDDLPELVIKELTAKQVKDLERAKVFDLDDIGKAMIKVDAVEEDDRVSEGE